MPCLVGRSDITGRESAGKTFRVLDTREVESVDKSIDGLVASRELSPEGDNNMG
jgi:hypothetical protein